MQLMDKIAISDLQTMCKKMSEPLVKAVVDINKRLLVVDAEMHVDEEQFLLERGSSQADLWGINLWPEHYGTADFVEFDSMINIRPWQNNRTRSIDNQELQEKIVIIVMEKVHG